MENTVLRWKYLPIQASLVLLLFSFAAPEAHSEDRPGISDRHDFRWDLNAAMYVSVHGDDLVSTGFSRVLPTDRIPRNYLGFDYTYRPGEESWARSHWVDSVLINPHVEMNFHARGTTAVNLKGIGVGAAGYPYFGRTPYSQPLSFDLSYGAPAIVNVRDQEMIRFALVFQDAWIRFRLPNRERTTFRIGHFDIPYGTNPIIESRRGEFIMPPEMMDVGLKKDWGVAWKGPAGSHDYEIALTSGMGLGIWNPRWFGGDTPPSYVLSARVGAPTYRKFQYGLSGLYGRIPSFMGDVLIYPYALQRWRVNMDAFYRPLDFIAYAFQIGGGENQLYPATGDEPVLAGHLMMDYVPPRFRLVNLKGQLKWVLNRLGDSHWDYWGLILEAGFSLTDALFLRIDYEHVFRSPVTAVPKDSRFYVGLNYYR